MLMQKASKETLLFVDDEESIREVASEFFVAKGYHILTAENGRIATEIIAQEKIDCCFTDINMPEMDGLELAEHIRTVDNTIPVIIMTAYSDFETTITSYKKGAFEYLDNFFYLFFGLGLNFTKINYRTNGPSKFLNRSKIPHFLFS